MIIVTTQREGAAIMSIEGRLDGQHAQTAESSFLAQAAEGNTRFIFDFSAMQYISSAGLRVVLVAAKSQKPARTAHLRKHERPSPRRVRNVGLSEHFGNGGFDGRGA